VPPAKPKGKAGKSRASRPKPKAKPKPKPKVAASPASGGGTGKAAPKPPKPVGKPGVRSDADLSVAGQIYQRGRLVPGILHIDGKTGKILRVVKAQTLEEHIDFGSLAILPGGLDVHVHFREPGHTHKEDFLSGSTAAAFGGITGFVDMPNTLPATTTARAVKEKMELASKRCVVDYGLWAGGTWYTGEIAEMMKYAVGVKTYLGATTGDLLLEDQEPFKHVLEAAGKAGRPVALHCESQRVLHQLRRTEGTLEDHDHARPPLAEVEAIYDAMKATAGLKRPPTIHIAHMASPDALQAASTAKFSIGVCPHHLLLDTSSTLSHAYGKVNPPLRSPQVREALWKAFAAGKIPILESDHAPHTKVEKEDNFHTAPSGMPGVETMMPLMLAQAMAKKVELRTVVDALTVAPAELLGLGDRGTLEAGMRADFAVYDLKKPAKVTADALHSRCGWTPFEGHKGIFPTHTYLAGKPVVAEGSLVAAEGSGRSLLKLP
jgi:dihydroorotase